MTRCAMTEQPTPAAGNIAAPPDMSKVLSQYETEPDFSKEKLIPFKDILSQHRKRYYFPTKRGVIILKYLTHLDMEKVTLDLVNNYPDYLPLAKRSNELLEKSEQHIKMNPEGTTSGLNPDEMDELANIGTKLMPYTKAYHLPLFVSPVLNSIDEFDALMSALDNDEQKGLLRLIKILSATTPDGKVSKTNMLIARDHGIHLAPDLTGENMTAQQAAAFTDVSMDTNDKLLKTLNELKEGGKNK